MARIDKRRFSAEAIIVAVSLWLVLFCNASFFSHAMGAYPLSNGNFGFIVSLGVLLLAVTVFLLGLFSPSRILKPQLIVMLLLSATAAYFMDSYNVIISTEVIDSALETDAAESAGLLSVKLALYVGLLGGLPALMVYRTPTSVRSLRASLQSRFKLLFLSAIVIVATLSCFNSTYASFFREHKSTRFYTNPATIVYTIFKYAGDTWLARSAEPYRQIGLDAHQAPVERKRKLLILVVGETARSDHFSLNGYSKNTNPYLSAHEVSSFDNVWSCGTATSIAVPCMFSMLDQAHYSERQARNTDNVLDIIQRAGVNVVWLDNNSSSKGVAARVPHFNYRDRKINPDCDSECRDTGMLVGAQKYVLEHPNGDILIVLHQMGSHGPEYAKRYPLSFEHFSQSCQSNLLEQCSASEIANAYDNSIRYTDYFLSRVVDYLESESANFSPAMLYISDHGESLGEKGIYLHGFPYALAPEEQKHVPMIFWSGAGYEDERKKLADHEFIHQRFTQDNLSHTLLGLMKVKTEVYQPTLDIFSDA